MRGPILFVCQHGSAKSVIAAENLNRLARERGLPIRAESAGVEPDSQVPSHVVDGLATDGMDVTGYAPNLVTSARLAAAGLVVSLACDLDADVLGPTPVERWDDVPMVSDGFAVARDAIVARVEQLIAALTKDA